MKENFRIVNDDEWQEERGDDNPFAGELLIPVDDPVEDFAGTPTLDFIEVEELELPNENVRTPQPTPMYLKAVYKLASS